MKSLKLAFVVGTRPEVIKLAPVILEAKRRGHSTFVIETGQHQHMTKPLLKLFKIKPNLKLQVMKNNQSLTGLSSRLLAKLDLKLKDKKFDGLLVQGDTTSALISGYWAFCHNVPVIHVEAGLRTNILSSPFPEEANRQLLSRISNLHFAPTTKAKKNLVNENISPTNIFVVGNTAIDSILKITESHAKQKLNKTIQKFISNRDLVLVTAHRRESFGKSLNQICCAILDLVNLAQNTTVIFPVHPNPNVKSTVERLLRDHPQILLCKPLSYLQFTLLMSRAKLILTDSGGVQEEAPTLRVPILVLRENTERPEGVRLGFSKLVGANRNKILKESLNSLKVGCQGRGTNPYGNGQASQRIISILEKKLG